MKTLRILAIVCIALGFTTKINAQSTSSKEIFYDWNFYIDCMGENAVGTLILHYVVHFDKEGNETKWHWQPQAGVLIGEKTGIVYHTTGVTQEQIKSPLSDGTFNDVFINHAVVVGVTKEGRAIRWGARYVFHAQVTKDEINITLVDKSVTFCEL